VTANVLSAHDLRIFPFVTSQLQAPLHGVTHEEVIVHHAPERCGLDLHQLRVLHAFSRGRVGLDVEASARSEHDPRSGQIDRHTDATLPR